MNISIDLFQKTMQAYENAFRPFRKETGLNQTSLDILLFLANNPKYTKAKDIEKYRGIRANLISMTLEKLEDQELIELLPSRSDRRSKTIQLLEKADPIIEQGRAIQKRFFTDLLKGIKPNEIALFFHVLEQIKHNLEGGC